MDQIKTAFQKVKRDIDFLKQEVTLLSKSLTELREQVKDICEILGQLAKKTEDFVVKHPPLDSAHNRQISAYPTHPSTHNAPLEALKGYNLLISTGNQGVPTDRQTDRQTDQQAQKFLENSKNSIDNAAEILDSIDSIKKEIRLKFKRLTGQEMLVFSALYQIDEESGPTDYKTLSQKLNLTESSIRDYIGRIIKKGIPLEKKRINNKNIQLSISNNLKKITSLSTILQLRNL